MSTETVFCLMPEMVLVAAATLIFLAGVFIPGRAVWSAIAAGAVVLAGWMLYGQYTNLFWAGGHPVRDAAAAEMERAETGAPAPEYPAEPILSVALAGPLKVDLFSQYVRWLVLVVALVLVLMSLQLAPDVQVPEYLGTLLLAVAGMMIVASAQELVLLFVGLELISIPTYILLYLGRRTVESQEATAKYFYLSILSSAITLYGFSFLYGAGGSTELARIQEALGNIDETSGMLWFARLALVLIFAGLCFKVTAVPFHFYAPDVYQGTTATNATVLSVLPKLGGLVVLVRIVLVAMPGFETYAWQIALVLALLTMTLGNVVALWQDNVRRLLAYSSIAHGGYMLIGLAVAFAAGSGADAATGFDGIGAMLFYITVYALATAGAFATIVYLGRDDRPIENVDELAGAARAYPWAGISMAIFMFSLTGIPPLAGFWGKLNLFAGALSVRPPNADAAAPREWFLFLAVIGVLNAAISAGYYLRIVGVMYFRSSSRELKAQAAWGPGAAMLLCAALVVLVGLQPNPVQVGANAAAQSARLPGTPFAAPVAATGNADAAEYTSSVAAAAAGQ
ncbi:MAG TPA: NADH-quinone oxidoreductase subunit N [Pirellulales bacterium]|nr:NADH-quinone oxidoreductase subunit N [Pirellulales bacterium]